MEDLFSKLRETATIGNKLHQRDLALALLIANHNFDVTKAMQSRMLPNPQKIFNKDQSAELLIFPGLSDGDYEAILQFAHTEKWPITPFGMFNILKSGIISSSLVEAFFHTPYFMSVETLFGRVDKPIKNLELLQIILQGDWEQLSTFYSEQRALLDLSQAKRQKFLLGYIEQGSHAAAYMLLKTEGKTEILKLDNGTIIKILNLLDERNPQVIDLALNIIKSSTNRELLHAANNRLMKFNEQTQPAGAVASRTPQQQQVPKTYIVKEGDSLWKIAKNLRVNLNKLEEINGLDDSSILQPGMQLEVP